MRLEISGASGNDLAHHELGSVMFKSVGLIKRDISGVEII